MTRVRSTRPGGTALEASPPAESARGANAPDRIRLGRRRTGAESHRPHFVISRSPVRIRPSAPFDCLPGSGGCAPDGRFGGSGGGHRRTRGADAIDQPLTACGAGSGSGAARGARRRRTPAGGAGGRGERSERSCLTLYPRGAGCRTRCGSAQKRLRQSSVRGGITAPSSLGAWRSQSSIRRSTSLPRPSPDTSRAW